MLASSKDSIISELSEILLDIERELRSRGLWREARSHSQDEWLPLEEWIEFIMLPRDRASLLGWVLPPNFRVWDMADTDFQNTPHTLHLRDLLRRYQTLLEKYAE